MDIYHLQGLGTIVEKGREKLLRARNQGGLEQNSIF